MTSHGSKNGGKCSRKSTNSKRSKTPNAQLLLKFNIHSKIKDQEGDTKLDKIKGVEDSPRDQGIQGLKGLQLQRFKDNGTREVSEGLNPQRYPQNFSRALLLREQRRRADESPVDSKFVGDCL